MLEYLNTLSLSETEAVSEVLAKVAGTLYELSMNGSEISVFEIAVFVDSLSHTADKRAQDLLDEIATAADMAKLLEKTSR